MSQHAEIFETKPDEQELILKAKNGCKGSASILYERFRPMLRNEAIKQSRYHRNVEEDDAFQESALYFLECIQTYSPEESKGRGLRYWAKTCVILRMISFWKSRTIIHTPKWEAWDTLGDQVATARRARLFSSLTNPDQKPRDPLFVDSRAVDPAVAAADLEEKEILQKSLSGMDKTQRTIIRRRFAGDTYEEAGNYVNAKLGLNISAHRESMRQRAERALWVLKNRILKRLGRELID